MFFVAVADGLCQFVQLLAVVELDLGFASKHVAKFVDNAKLDFQPVIQRFELIVQLHTNVCKRKKPNALD